MCPIRLLICAAVFVLPQIAADLNAIKAEPDLNKRAEMAMAYAGQSADEAGKAFDAGEIKGADARLEDVRAAVELACDSLRETHKAPRNNKYYKRVELSMSTLLRHMDDLGHVAPPDDPILPKVEKRIQALHDQILLDIMSKRK